MILASALTFELFDGDVSCIAPAMRDASWQILFKHPTPAIAFDAFGENNCCETHQPLMKHQSGGAEADAEQFDKIADSKGCGDSSKGPKSPRMESQEGKVRQLTRRADFFASRARYADALPLVDQALLLEPNRPELHLGRGQCLMQLDKLEEALTSFEAALRLDSQCISAQRNKALLLAKQQRWHDAILSFREALSVEPTQELRMELARCLTEHAIQLKAAGHGDLQLFHEAIQACDSYAPAFFQLGVCYSEVNDSVKAKEMYRKAVQLHPGYVEALNNLGVACRELGEWEHAIEAYGMALKVNQNCSKTRENMAISLLQLGCRHLQRKELKEAGKALKQGLSFNSRNADIYFNLGVLYAEKEKWDQAKVNYELASNFDPRHANAHNNLGVIHSSERARPSKYAGHAQRGSEAASEFPSLLTVRNATANASSIHFQKRIEGSRDSLRGRAALLEVEDIYKPAASKRGLKQTSGDGSASISSRCSLPATCMHANTQRLGNPEAAMKCFESALEVDSKMNLASKNLGAIYGSMGRMDDAIRLTRVAIDSNRQDAEGLQRFCTELSRESWRDLLLTDVFSGDLMESHARDLVDGSGRDP
eukprot:s2317_g18.t2